jgi:serine/threonine protein kinase
MSPEQVTGRGVVDCRSDVYSLGLVLYELLALRPPIEAGNREHLLRAIVTKPLPPISWRNSAVQGDLERVVHKATQKDPDQRYASAAEFAADLDRCLAGKPALAPPYRFRLDEREITAAGETNLTQSGLGIEPFSIMGGAIAVADEIVVRFELVATQATAH